MWLSKSAICFHLIAISFIQNSLILCTPLYIAWPLVRASWLLLVYHAWYIRRKLPYIIVSNTVHYEDICGVLQRYIRA